MSTGLPNDFSNLEICREIFLRSPAESLFRFRAVCKGWRTVIDDPSFARAHTFDHHLSSTTLVLRNRMGRPFEPLHTFDIGAQNFLTPGAQAIPASSLDLNREESSLLYRLPVSTCNGLLLLDPYYIDDPLEIWNPSTHERLQLPLVDYYHSRLAFLGLGYDHTTQDLKAVAMDCRQFHVYSLRSDTWRMIRHYLCCDDLYAEEQHGVFVHGALHWLLPLVDYYHSRLAFLGLGYDHTTQDLKAVAMDCRQFHVYSLRSDTWRMIRHYLCCDDLYAEEQHGVFVHGALHWLLDHNFTIIALDLATEKHRHIQVNVLPETGFRKKIDVLGGCLAVSGNSIFHFNVWVMKDYGSDDESWIKLLSIKRVDLTDFFTPPFRPVAYMNSDKKQVFLKDGGSGFFMYDFESDSMKRVRIRGLTGKSYAQIIPRSMFRLSDNCGGGSGGRRGRRFIPLYQPQKRKLSLIISKYPPGKKHKKNS